MAADVDLSRFEGVIFDLDGVVTRTARVHAAAWKQLFDEFLTARARSRGESAVPFDADADYRSHVDGKPRYAGVSGFLGSRGIELPFGAPSDPPGTETVCGLGNRKNRLFLELTAQDGVDVYETTVLLVRALRSRGIRVAIISASRNCTAVLRAADLADLFDVQVDGVDVERLAMPGKPAPDMLLEAAARLGVEPERAAIVEDALAGVEAGRRGGFGLVIGVDRADGGQALLERGADLAIRDLAECTAGSRVAGDLPSALDAAPTILARIRAEGLALFLDYDGTLTPIVDRPEDAVLSDDVRAILRRVGLRCPVAVVSGRDRPVVEQLVGITGFAYIGSHGFDIVGPPGSGVSHQVACELLPALEAAEARLRERLAGVSGVLVERKRFTVATHVRLVRAEDRARVEHEVGAVVAAHSGLRQEGGKAVFEVRPDLEWDKGRAILWLRDALGLSGSCPMHIGDDLTDEMAFRAIAGWGIGIVVADDGRPTAADYRLTGPAEVARFLAGLADALGAEHA